MPGYLLDTNHISAWERKDVKLMGRFRNATPENIVWVCPVSLAEIEWGFRTTSTTNAQRRTESRTFIEECVLNFVWPIGIATRHSYAEIMERIWRTHPPPSGRTSTQQHLCDLGVDVNDVWIAAVALERNFTLLTDDQMETIRTCVPDVKIENWLK